jgi:hypothetical protein
MSAICETPAVIKPLASNASSPDLFVSAIEDGPPAPCRMDLNGDDLIQCQSFTKWTQMTASLDGAIALAAQVCQRELSGDNQQKVFDLCKALYDGIAGVNQQFLAAIVDINAGKSYNPIVEPDTIPAFPSPTGGVAGIVQSAWDIAKPWLEAMMGKMAPGSPWVKVLDGVITSSDAIVTDIQAAFTKP